MTTAPAVKVCGLTRREDAAVAGGAGATFGGVILARGRTRSVDVPAAAAIFEGIPLRRVGVFVDPDLDEVLAAADALSLDVVQLHGDEDPALAEALRQRGLRVWKALRPRSASDLMTGISRFADSAHGLLLDGWSERGEGGTGTSFAWEEIAPHRGSVPRRLDLIVAGGLTPENVVRAVALLRPTVVDVSSGVESAPRVKSHPLIRAFVAAAIGNPRNSAG